MRRIDFVYPFLPPRFRRGVASAVELSREAPIEIRISVGGGSSVRFPSRRVHLGLSLSRSEIEKIFTSLTGGALYAHRSTVEEGYISLGGGVRVGVCGQARYEGDRLVGISDVSSLLVRIPSEECSFAEKLCSAFEETRSGMLIIAPPSGGKTTALRALIKRLATRKVGLRISVIDERGELDTEDFSSLGVDVFKGYRRGEGMRIAIRVMSPEVIAVDELGASRESEDMLESLLSGVKFIATAHGSDFEEVKNRRNLIPFFSLGVFDTLVRIFNTDTGFRCEIKREERKNEAFRHTFNYACGNDCFCRAEKKM